MTENKRELAAVQLKTRLNDNLANAVVRRRQAPPVPGKNVYKSIFPSTARRLVWVVDRECDLDGGEKWLARAWNVDFFAIYIFVRSATEDAVPTDLNTLKSDVEEQVRELISAAVQSQEDGWQFSRVGYVPADDRFNQGVFGAGILRVSARHYE